MQLQFQKQEIGCLRNLLKRVQTLEQTQELTVPEGHESSEILGVWGQVLLRSKERQGDRLLITGGIQTWVLLSAAEGERNQCLNAWIPFRLDWDLPGDAADGADRIMPVISGMDARWTGAGKLLIRAGISVLAECWQPDILRVPRPGDTPQDVALQTRRWPVRLPKETGEKTFAVEEALTLPPSAPAVEKVLYDRMEPVITDKKVVGNKIVFRGSGNLHMTYLCPEGMVHSWDFELPFSQYAELADSYSPDAQVDVIPVMTRLELEHSADGTLHLQAGLTGQYLVEDRQILETVTDAFSPRREMTVDRQMIAVPAVLDTLRETVSAEQKLDIGPDNVADTAVLTDFPRFSRQGDAVELELPHRAQILYYDGEGILRGMCHRWTESMAMKTEENTALTAQPGPVRTRLLPEMDGLMLNTQMPVTITAMDGSGVPAVTALDLGELQDLDPARPSLILRRAGMDSLWEIARQSGSTVAAIMGANALEGEPEPDRMLLIPVI